MKTLKDQVREFVKFREGEPFEQFYSGEQENKRLAPLNNLWPDVVEALELAEKFHNHIFSKDKRVDWGVSFVDWDIVNNSLVSNTRTLAKIKEAVGKR